MRLIFRIAILGAIAGFFSISTGLARQPMNPSWNDHTVTRNLVYTPEGWPEKVSGDLYQPRGAYRAPAVLLIHGGGWSGGDGRWQMEPIAKQLVQRGYVVLNVTYRQAPRWIFPAPVDDMREALKWLRDHADERGIDASRIATFGYSAGGYLAEFAGYLKKPGDPPVRAVVAGGAPGNLAFYPGGDLVPQFLGGTQQENPQVFHDASPINCIGPGSPPTFLYQAEQDRLVKPEHALATIDRFEKYGVRHEVYWIKGKGHIRAFLFPENAINRAIDFLDRELR